MREIEEEKRDNESGEGEREGGKEREANGDTSGGHWRAMEAVGGPLRPSGLHGPL